MAKPSHIELASLLNSIDIELSGYCNAMCLFCPRDKITREKALMSESTFEVLLSELAILYPDGPEVIYFCGLGEPLMNKNMCAYADHVNDVLPDTFVVVVSNGGLLNKEICDAVLSGGVYTFSCSIQSIHKDHYEAVMKNLDFQAVLHWMNYLAQRKHETGLQITATFVKLTQSDVEIEEYSEYWRQLGVAVGMNELHNRGGSLDCASAQENLLRRSCSIFNTRLFVAANGDVLACCNDLDGQSRLGTIGVDSLETILAKKMDMIQNMKLFPMCIKCNDSNVETIHAVATGASNTDKRILNNVTLVCIDCVNPLMAYKALKYSSRDLAFYNKILLTSHDVSFDDVTVVKIDPLTSMTSYNSFCLKELVKYVKSDFMLTIHTDGFIINPHLWTDDFLDYDYIGAPWPTDAPWCVNSRVGNGGFSLRSRRFMELALQLNDDANSTPEDILLTNTHYEYFTALGCRYAPVHVAMRFALEAKIPECEYNLNNSFGFHGKGNAYYHYGEGRQFMEKIELLSL